MPRLVRVAFLAYPQPAAESPLEFLRAYRPVVPSTPSTVWIAGDTAGGPRPGDGASDETRATSRAHDRVLYPGPAIVVTRTYIETADAIYRVRDLTVEDPSYLYIYPSRLVALYCGALEVLLAAVAGAMYDAVSWMLCGAGSLAAVGVGGAIWLDGYRNPRHMTLTALHRGRRVVLFTTDNQRIFEQVRRAIVRAVEANRSSQL